LTGINWADEITQAGAKPAAGDGPVDWTAELTQTAAPAPQGKPQAAKSEGWGEWAARLPLRAYNAAVGTHDPNYKHLKAFDDTPAAGDTGYKARATLALIGGADDTAYGDIIQRSLGDKFIRRFKDANGYDIIEHKGADGKPTMAYVNKPGLDVQDIGRGMVGALPYVIGGTWMGGLKGAATIPGVIAQGGLAGATSLAGDTLAAGAGAEAMPDVNKAATTAVFGTAGAMMQPVVGALWRRFVTIPGLIDANGKLTAKGLAAAKSAGIDDASALEGKIAQEFASTYAKTGDAAAAAVKAETGAYGVETTLGQRTKDPMQLLREKGYRMGNYGDAAKQQIVGLDQRQSDQIERMVRGNVVPSGSVKTEPGMLERLAPNRPYVHSDPLSLGRDIRDGVAAARDAAKAGERAAWSEVPDLVPNLEAFSDLAPMVTDRLAGRRLSTSTPKALEMDAALADYASGKVVASGTKLVDQSPIQTADDMRRHLKDILFSVERDNAADKAAATAIYDGYNQWVRESAKKSLMNGDADKAANLFKAVDLTKEMHTIFKPTGQNFKPNAATRIMDTVLSDATPERIVTALFSNPTKSTIKDGAVQALRSIKAGLDRYTPDTAAETWNTIRVAHWAKLTQGADGKLFSPTVMSKNIDAAIQSQRSLMYTLYSPGEMSEMMRISRVLKSVSWKDPNPSGTATASQGLLKEFFGTLMRALPIGNTAKMALEFSGIASRARNAAGTVGVNNALAQGLPTVTNPAVSGYAGGMANALYNNQ